MDLMMEQIKLPGFNPQLILDAQTGTKFLIDWQRPTEEALLASSFADLLFYQELYTSNADDVLIQRPEPDSSFTKKTSKSKAVTVQYFDKGLKLSFLFLNKTWQPIHSRLFLRRDSSENLIGDPEHSFIDSLAIDCVARSWR